MLLGYIPHCLQLSKDWVFLIDVFLLAVGDIYSICTSNSCFPLFKGWPIGLPFEFSDYQIMGEAQWNRIGLLKGVVAMIAG
jgi:hypothetical protein